MLNIEQEVAAYERNVLSSSLITLAEEISAQLARTGIVIKTENGERPATLEDLRRIFQEFGLELTTRPAVDWSTRYPGQARSIDLICALQQRADDLSHELTSLTSATEKKEDPR